MSRILLTGHRGYISGKLIPKLESLDYSVSRFDGDVAIRSNWFDHANIDYVIHLAAVNDLYAIEENYNLGYSTNVWGSILAADFCVRRHAKLIFLSTDTVLGPDGAGVPSSVYDSHKLAVEKIYAAIPELDSVALRLSTAYGHSPAISEQKNRGVVNKWIKSSIGGDTIKVYSGVANKRRDFVHVDDVVEAITLAMSKDVPKGNYNICTGIGTTLMDMACKIDLLSGGSGVEIVPDPEGLNPIEYRTFVRDHNLFTFYTGWQPKIDLNVGVTKTIEAFGGRLKDWNVPKPVKKDCGCD